jgi:2-polyprenyl-3-methyl-5-hydroxy-6-metoxy-1,4-benzoquinol methylase
MNLEELRANWDELGSTDPLWAILSVPEYKGNRWSVEEFFRSGEAAVADILGRIGGELGLPAQHRRALDFGCGVGRLTQALADHFDEVDGVDIAPSMIDGARSYNRAGDRCTYHLNEREDLEIFEDLRFDFVLSEIVFQHIQPQYALRYIGEFVRVLSPLGLLVFQVPYESVNPTSLPEPWDRSSGPRIAERGGAERVVAVDIYPPSHFGFDQIRQGLGSNVDFVQASVYDFPRLLDEQFDVVLFLGMLYHLRHPLLAIDSLHKLTRGTVYVETAVCAARPAVAHAEFYPTDTLLGDGSNWFLPSTTCLCDWFISSGFTADRVETWPEPIPSRALLVGRPTAEAYRAISYEVPLSVVADVQQVDP